MKLFKSLWVLIILIIISFSGLSCSNHTQNSSGMMKPISVENLNTDSSESSEFTLGPGDKISVSVWRNSDLDRSLTLDPSGKIRMPLAGELNVSGMSVSDLNKEITARLSKYISDPFVDINVTSIASRKVHIMGEVKSPGTFSYTDQLPVWEAVSKAGGFTDDANMSNLLLVRIKEGRTMVSALELDFKKIFKNGIITSDYYLTNGDILYIPETNIAGIEKFMNRLNSIISPINTIERSIYLAPDVIDILSGKGVDRDVVVSQ